MWSIVSHVGKCIIILDVTQMCLTLETCRIVGVQVWIFRLLCVWTCVRTTANFLITVQHIKKATFQFKSTQETFQSKFYDYPSIQEAFKCCSTAAMIQFYMYARHALQPLLTYNEPPTCIRLTYSSSWRSNYILIITPIIASSDFKTYQ